MLDKEILHQNFCGKTLLLDPAANVNWVIFRKRLGYNLSYDYLNISLIKLAKLKEYSAAGCEEIFNSLKFLPFVKTANAQFDQGRGVENGLLYRALTEDDLFMPWKKLLVKKYSEVVVNLTEETLALFNYAELLRLQALLDLAELGYKLSFKKNLLENLVYAVKVKKMPEQFPFEHWFFSCWDIAPILKYYLEQNNTGQLLDQFYSNHHPQPFDMQNRKVCDRHLGHVFHIFDLVLGTTFYNEFAYDGDHCHFMSREALLYIMYTKGPTYVMKEELFKLSNLNIGGVSQKPNSSNSSLSLELAIMLYAVTIARYLWGNRFLYQKFCFEDARPK